MIINNSVLLLTIILYSGNMYSGDTSKILFSKVKEVNIPNEFNISDINIFTDSHRYVLSTELEIPVTTVLSMFILDTSGSVVFYLLTEQIIGSGTYNISWEMEKCNSANCPYPAGKYFFDIETSQFYYRRDFTIK